MEKQSLQFPNLLQGKTCTFIDYIIRNVFSLHFSGIFQFISFICFVYCLFFLLQGLVYCFLNCFFFFCDGDSVAFCIAVFAGVLFDKIHFLL